MAKHTWVDDELITKDLLNSIEDRIEAKAQKGDIGPQGLSGERGPTGPPGKNGTNGIFTQQLESITIAGEEPTQIKIALENLINDLKVKGLMK